MESHIGVEIFLNLQMNNLDITALTFDLLCTKSLHRAIGSSENLRVPVLFGGHNLPLLVETGLTDLMAPPVPPGTTTLTSKVKSKFST